MEERKPASGVAEALAGPSLVDGLIKTAIDRFKSSPETYVDEEDKIRVYMDTQALHETIDEVIANGLKPKDLFDAVRDSFPLQPDTLDALSVVPHPKTWDDFSVCLSTRVLEDNMFHRMDAETQAELERRWELPDPSSL